MSNADVSNSLSSLNGKGYFQYSLNKTVKWLQIFSYTKKKALQSDDVCVDVSAIGGPVKLFQCHGLGGNQQWEYNKEVFYPALVGWVLFDQSHWL